VDLSAFPLSWRWTQPAHAMLPREVLRGLLPLESDAACVLSASAPMTLGPRATKCSAVDVEEATQWLASLATPAERVILVWNPSTALSMPWEVFVTYWSDFCYPSSDDVDVFVDGGPPFLRWHHFEEFEYDADAL